MYLSIWFGILLSSQTGCSTHKDTKPSLAEVKKVEAGEILRRRNEPSSLPTELPKGVKLTYSQVNTIEPVLAMTFDDGPHPSLTPRLLDLLKERNIKATFFVVGSNAKAYPQIIRRIIAEGHEIGNHTYTHCSLPSRSDDQIRKELNDSKNAISAATDYSPQLVRPPYGAINARIKQLMYSEFGYSTIMWSVDPQDWRRPGSAVVTSRLVNGARPGAIMLAHDIHPGTITAMPSMFDQLLAKGYQFVTVSQLINMEKVSMPIGAVIPAALPVIEKDPSPLPQ
jgi:peptidoglycan/xylan/chitin deacetylase (PgdA/CDA1 family)